jgi:competence ComEA-like helix-hairpin-helix protein
MRRLMFAVGILAAALVAATPSAWAQSPKAPAVSKARATASAPVNLNAASVAQLQTLPGVGASTAQRIVDYRQKNGGFKKIEEIFESSSSCPYLLMILEFVARQSVSTSR